jgi:GT2 family glycosyltransferase
VTEAASPSPKLPGKGPAERSAPISAVAAGKELGRASGAASVEHDDAHGMVLGVIVPCRNDEAAIARKLHNLAQSRWPFSTQPHQIVIVDDGSTDGTAARATALCAELFPKPSGSTRMSVPSISHTTPAGARVVANARTPGRAGAVRTGLETLGSTVDLIVITDADVVLRPNSLLMFEAEFRRRPELGMLCGRQELVRDLMSDGSCRGADGKDPVAVAEAWDEWSARLRRWESERGRLFCVHGQLLAWRERLGLCPTPGEAADDIDLMFQVRSKGLRIEMLPGAAFLQIAPPPGAARTEWQTRRAKAWLAALRDRRSPSRAPAFDRWQLRFYRCVPMLASPGLHVLTAIVILGAGAALGAAFSPEGREAGAFAGVGVGAVVLAVLMVSSIGRGTRAILSRSAILRAARG